MDLLQRIQRVAGIRDEQHEYQGETFTFRKMSSALLDAYDGERQKRLKMVQRGKNLEVDLSASDLVGMRAALACMVLVDDSGNLAYDWRNQEHIKALNAVDGEFLDWVSDIAIRMNPHLSGGDPGEAEKN